MRVLHIFTLHGGNNEFGGPIRVAINLAIEQLKRGNQVTLCGLQRGFPELLKSIEGVPAKLFEARSVHRSLSFSGLYSVRQLWWILQNVRNYDVVHIHMARDLVTLPSGFICTLKGVPFVIQTHGMVGQSSKFLAAVLDRLLTKSVLNSAHANLSLTWFETESLRVVGGEKIPIITFPNGLSIPTNLQRSVPREVGLVFYSRLHLVKRPLLFLEVVAKLQREKLITNAQIAGADGGELAEVASVISNMSEVEYVGALQYNEGLEYLSRALVMVLPSSKDWFPMSVLESLSVGTPVVMVDTCGLAPYIEQHGGGIVSNGSVEDLVQSVKTILGNWQTYSDQARKLAENQFSIEAVVDEVMEIYEGAIASKAH